jgi:hypothetical protein
MTLTAGTLGTLALLLVQIPWSNLVALPVSLALLLPLGILLAGAVELLWHGTEWMRQRPDPSSSSARWRGRIAATIVGGAILFGGAIVSNLAFVDEPVEGMTLVGYAVSAALALGSTVLLGRSKTFCEVCVSVDVVKASIVVPILLGITLAVVDALAFPFHYGRLHRLLEVAALSAFVLGIRAALARPRGGAHSTLGKVAAALAMVTLLTGLSAAIHGGTRAASVEAAIRWPTAHRRVVTSVRSRIDADGDGHSPWLGGGDCDDGDPSAHPLSTHGDPCMDLSPDPERPMLERSEALDRSQVPNVLVWVTIDAFRCGFGGLMEERSELEAVCPELTGLAREGKFGVARATSPTTKDSLRAMHGLGAERSSQQREFFVDRLGELGFHRLMVPATRLVVRSPADRGGYDEIVEDLLRDADGSRTTLASRQTDLVIDVLRRAVDQHERVFLWAHYYDPHAPYVRDASESLVLGTDVSRYRAEIRRTDAAVARLARSLRDELGRSDIVLLVTADHAEEFGEHGATRHGANLYDTSVRLPMLVWRTTADLARSSLPSLLPVGGHQIGDYFVALAAGSPFGRRDEVYMRGGPDGDSQVGVVVGSTKLIYRDSLGYSELYDLEKDPWERINLAAARPAQVRLLLSLIRADSRRQGKP